MPQTLYFNIMLILLAILERGGSLTVELGNGNEESLKPANGQKKKKKPSKSDLEFEPNLMMKIQN